MRSSLLVILMSCLVACDNAGTVKVELDSAVSNVKNSAVLDSLEVKSGRLLDTVKTKSGDLWDSTKSKSGKLIKKAEDKLNNLKNDSTN